MQATDRSASCPRISGYVSTEVDPRLSFDTEESLVRARRIIQMYEEEGIDRGRVLIKLAATWEGIAAAEILEKEGITCNLTLVFGTLQAKACAQRGVRLISPFPGRILDWHKADQGFDSCPPNEDPGVIACAEMYGYFKASWDFLSRRVEKRILQSFETPKRACAQFCSIGMPCRPGGNR